ncbi:FAD-dependent oxidoreductase, partial [Candidatus Dependentiae bacterium]|nr:FAD-dependent oxidoreductase [Candidatus Dependentiae bacterium]
PAGITAGIELLKTEQVDVTVLERDVIIGGLARTNEYKGYRYDIGPHHFITNSDEVMEWWMDMMADDFHPHKRYTRILYNKHFFHYPLEPYNVITGLSLLECVKCVFSYIKARLFPIKKVKTFQDWITNRFGYRLFSIFFKTYTEKVWGITCDKISSDWAAQRIKGFSLSQAIFYAFFGRWFKKNAPRTLQDTFYYPSAGSGAFWERAANRLKKMGGVIHLEQDVCKLEHDGKRIVALNTRDAASNETRVEGDVFFSTMPLQTLIKSLHPLPDEAVIAAADALCYRGLITVNLIINKETVIPDHWLYVHEKSVRMGRIGNMNNFSIKMVADQNHTALSLEYFAFIDEPFWKFSDAELIRLGAVELEQLGIVKASDVIDGMVVKTAEAYPVYNQNYHAHLGAVLSYLKNFSNLYLMGRNGMHRYNNMDIAMLSAMHAVNEYKKADLLSQEEIMFQQQKHRGSQPLA